MSKNTLPHKPYSSGEETAHVITHGLGLALSLVGAAFLLSVGRRGDLRSLICASIYSATLVTLYAASTCYHFLSRPRLRRIARAFDHATIYLLIAGTYTPFTLLTLRGPWGWTIFGVIWGLAALGLCADAFWKRRPKWTSLGLYLGMGWVVVIAFRPLVERLPREGLTLLLAGGLAYTAGTFFYALKRIRYAHAVWHVFVLLGSACHFLTIWRYVLLR